MRRPTPTRIPETPCVWDRSSNTFVPASGRQKLASEKFLKGPVPWSWIVRAARLPGASLPVSLCLWRLAGATHSMTIKLSNEEVAALGVDRHAKSRALKHLEAAGLVTVEHHRGRFPRVTVISAHLPAAEEARKPRLTECGF